MKCVGLAMLHAAFRAVRDVQPAVGFAGACKAMRLCMPSRASWLNVCLYVQCTYLGASE